MPVELNAVPGVVEDNLRDLGVPNGGAETLDRGGDLLVPGINVGGDSETRVGQQFSRVLCIVDRVFSGESG